MNPRPTVTCGIDWAEGHYDVAVIDADGGLVDKSRFPDTAEGFAAFIELLVTAGDTENNPIPVAIETPRGLLVSALRATGRKVYSINPMAVARYRERWTVARAKSDHADAMVLANILRTDAHAHRPLPRDSELARTITVLARAHQDATWRRAKATNELRSLLREYYPGFLHTFAAGGATNLAGRDARAILAIAPTPNAGARLTKARIATALRRGGRERNIDRVAAAIHHGLHRPQLRQLPTVEQAMGVQALALLAMLNAACEGIDQLGAATIEAFGQHPDHDVITSFPGLGELSGARVLAEIGDDADRFVDARALKAYAGSAPVTRASGRSLVITHRRIKNNRLAAVGYTWAFMAMTTPRPPELTTTSAGTPATVTQPRSDTSSTACSASCITACAPARPTTKPRPSPRRYSPRLDSYELSEVCARSAPAPTALTSSSRPFKP